MPAIRLQERQHFAHECAYSLVQRVVPPLDVSSLSIYLPFAHLVLCLGKNSAVGVPKVGVAGHRAPPTALSIY